MSTQAEAASLSVDERRPVAQGRLPNGLRYAVLPRRGRDPGVALFMRVAGGFLAERRPGERGLAHLIEHVVFHSPTRSAPTELDRFRQIGLPLTFPEPAGGTTSWRESDYFVVSRTTRPADLDTLLGLFREVAGELTFRVDAVDGQRAEVMREMADKRLGNDIYARYVAAVAPGSPTDVIDAQNSDDVSTASIATIRALYHRLYRPENTMVMIVGDVDPDAMAALVRKRFGDWRGVGPASARPAIPTFRPDRVPPISHSDLRYGRNSAVVTITAPLPRPSSRERQARALLLDMLAIRSISARLAATRANYPPGKYGAAIENGEQGHRLIIVWDEFVPGRWRPAIAGLSRTMCDLNTVGLSEEEWVRAKRDVMEDLERRAGTVADMPNFGLAKDLADALTAGRELIPPDELLRSARAWLPTFDGRAMNDWWRDQLRSGVEHIRVESPELAAVNDPVAAIRDAVDDAGRDTGCKVRRS